jgi:hypothetical protein
MMPTTEARGELPRTLLLGSSVNKNTRKDKRAWVPSWSDNGMEPVGSKSEKMPPDELDGGE